MPMAIVRIVFGVERQVFRFHSIGPGRGTISIIRVVVSMTWNYLNRFPNDSNPE